MKRIAVVLLFAACATKAPTEGNYSALYEISASEKIRCHFLMKKEKAFFPTVLCHDAEQAWVIPLKEMRGQVWVIAPLRTQSGSLIAFTDSESGDTGKINSFISTDQGRNWEIQALFLKKNLSDKLQKVLINKNGKLVATFSGERKPYDVVQDKELKSKFTPLTATGKSYPELCFQQYGVSPAPIPEACLSGYLKRLLNQ